MDAISNQMFSHDAEKWMVQPANSQVNAPAPFDLDPSKSARKAKDKEGEKEKGSKKPRDPRFPQLSRDPQ